MHVQRFKKQDWVSKDFKVDKLKETLNLKMNKDEINLIVLSGGVRKIYM